MNTRIIIIAFISIFLVSCNKSENLSIAYGNFESDILYVSAKSNGELLDFKVEKGQNLEANQVVGTIDTTTIFLQKEQLIAKRNSIPIAIDEINTQIKLVEIKKANLKTNYDRSLRLLENEATTQQQFDNIDTEIKIIDKQINQLKIKKRSVLQEINVIDKQIDLLDYKIEQCKITNPINGVVLDKFIENKELCMMGKPIYKIANIKQMTLKAYISASQLANVKIGDKLKVAIDGAQNHLMFFDGVISWISSEAEFTPKTIQTTEERINLVYAIEVQVTNNGTIKIGMPGEVHF